MRLDAARTGLRGRSVVGPGLALVAATALASLSLAACSSSSSGSPTAGTTTGGGAVTINTRSGADGTYLTDGSGKSLYDFANDTPTSSTCVGACLAHWPPLTGTATAGSGVTASLITTITRPDGSKQVAYNGHPLYYYVGDGAAGDINGQGSSDSGGLWWLISPAGDEIKKTG